MAFIPMEKTHEFRRENVPSDGSCMFTSVRFVLNVFNAIDNQRLRRQVADRIRLLCGETNRKDIENYCRHIQDCDVWGGEPELRTLALLCKVLLCVVLVTKNENNECEVNILRYGEDQHYEECVYILFDEANRHYDALHLCGKSDDINRQTIFERNDVDAQNLLRIFIRDQLGAINYAHLRIDNSDNVDASDSSPPIHHECVSMADLILSDLPKRKKTKTSKTSTPRSLPSEVDVERLPTAYDDRGKQPSVKRKHGNQCEESMKMEQLLQVDLFGASGSTPVPSTEPMQETASPMLLLSKKTVPNNDEQQEGMNLAVQPIEKFRGRTRHEYKPKKALKRNGQPSTSNPPSYFADRNNCHYFILQIPDQLLKDGLEDICVQIYMVTRELAGHTFIHPFFKFQGHPTDKNVDDLNPMYVMLNDNKELEDSSNGIRALKLYLVVIKLTYGELMKSQHQMTVFSSSNPDTPIVMNHIAKAADFIQELHLNDMRFVITLGKKNLNDEVFHPNTKTRFISDVTTQVKHPKR